MPARDHHRRRCRVRVVGADPGTDHHQHGEIRATTVPGATVQYTVTVTDTGQTPYTGAAVTDDLSGVLDDAAYNGDAAATAGSVSFASPGPDLDRAACTPVTRRRSRSRSP